MQDRIAPIRISRTSQAVNDHPLFRDATKKVFTSDWFQRKWARISANYREWNGGRIQTKCAKDEAGFAPATNFFFSFARASRDSLDRLSEKAIVIAAWKYDSDYSGEK